MLGREYAYEGLRSIPTQFRGFFPVRVDMLNVSPKLYSPIVLNIDKWALSRCIPRLGKANVYEARPTQGVVSFTGKGCSYEKKGLCRL